MAWWLARIHELRQRFPGPTTLFMLEMYFATAERDCAETEKGASYTSNCKCGGYAVVKPEMILVLRGVKHTPTECLPIICACPAKHPIYAMDEWKIIDGTKHTTNGCKPVSSSEAERLASLGLT